MKIKGFTLIELLAVIVILAIIALIAVPIILNIIGSSKKSSVLRSGELYLKAVETAIARENLNNEFNPTICTIKNDGNLTCTEGEIITELTIEVNGSKPTSGTINLNKGKIISVESMILDGNELKKEENDRLVINGIGTNPPIDDDKEVCSTGAMSSPEIYDGLTPVVYLDNNWVVANPSEKWYDYCKQEWANAVVLNTGVTKNVGDTVNVSSDIKAMFVWIPKYEYKIEGQYGTHTDGTAGTKEQPGEIKVNFISKDTTKASEGYRVHPAFTFGNTELNGIWVGKFETTGTLEIPTILPSITVVRSLEISEQFITAQKFSSYLTNVDAHMSKNSEWGAVAYLSQSKYGKYGNPNYVGADKQVMINNCSNYITGIGADEQNAKNTDTTCITNTYETTKGQAASTTGNITGIYDMSGGERESVMGVYNKTIGNSGFNVLPEEKYYDNYTTTDAMTACNGGICYGHALSETKGWYSDGSGFLNSEAVWFERGYTNYNSSNAGVFAFYNGYIHGYTAFRVVITEV